MTEDLLDNESITNHEAEITLDHGPSFTPRMRMFAIIFLIGALGMYASGGAGYIIGTGLLLGGIFVISSRHGTQISLKTNYVRAYHDRFFVKSGKWLPIAAFSDICILKISKTLTTSDLTGAVSTSMDVSKNEVFLMTHDHRKRFLLKICKSFKEATAYAEEMAEKLNKNFVPYNPKLTEQTKARLKHRR